MPVDRRRRVRRRVQKPAAVAGAPTNPRNEDRTMRYLCMHKVSPEDEAGQPPTQELMEGMGSLIGEMAASGAFVDGEGLLPSSERFRLTRAGDGWDVEQGPLTGRNELPTGMAIVKVGSVEEALDWGRRFGAAAGAQEVQVGPLTEEWDLTGSPRPADAPLRFMLLPMATPESEAGEAPGPRQRAALAKVTEEMRAAAVLATAQELLPSSAGVRLWYRDGERTVIDGPFAESKELIGGFCLMELASLDEVLGFVDRFVDVLGGTREIDVRMVAEKEGR
jgi:hypothetical protein